MARKKKTVHNLKIHGIADKGKAVGRTEEGQVVFVDHAVPGDVVDCLILRKKKGYLQGVVTETHSYSIDRTEPFCEHFYDCGGCKWQDMSYNKQLSHKHEQVKNAIEKIAKIDSKDILLPILGADKTKYYRNKLEFSFSSQRWKSKAEIESDHKIEDSNALGFHPPGFYNKIVDIQACYLQDNRSNEIRNAVRKYALEQKLSFYNTYDHSGFLRNMIVRNTSQDQWMLIMIFAKHKKKEILDFMNFIRDNFDFIDSIYYIVNEKLNDSIFDQKTIHFHGEKWIHEKLGAIKYKVSPKSFFQTNTRQAELLYQEIVNFADLKADEHVYDLYTGLGSIALYVAAHCKSVLGIEEVEMAISDAKFNADLNEINNASFYAGDVKDVLTPEFISNHPKPDVIITDPPRAGMHQDVIQTILELEASRIVYVSCNPSTQARDIFALKENYELIKLKPVDMFPHTHHVESIALLKKKS